MKNKLSSFLITFLLIAFGAVNTSLFAFVANDKSKVSIDLLQNDDEGDDEEEEEPMQM